MSRTILHVDMNGYFASVEQQANPFLRGKPIVVTGKRFDTTNAYKAQRSVVATKSIETKARGVKTGMSTWEAIRICPDLLIIPGDPEKYSEVTHQFNAIFREVTDELEQFSVDESFLDVTQEAKDYMGAVMVAQYIRMRLREVCGERITASIGVAPNKLMAKLASEFQKPDGLTVVRPEQVMAFLQLVELQDFCGIGPRIARRLDNMGIRTVQQLQECSIDRLEAEFKSYGRWLHNAAYGRDDSELITEDEAPKSVGHSYTISHDVTEPKELKRNLLGLADKVAWRMRRDGFMAQRVNAYLRFKDLGGRGQQHRFHEPTADGLQLFKVAWSMIQRWWEPGTPVRLVGISASMLTRGPEQQPLFPHDKKIRATHTALDKIQTRYGSGSWTRASLLNVEFKARSSGWHYDHEL